MEHLARIINCQKLENSQLWEYQFLDIKSNQQDYFYHHKQIDYNPNLAGKLEITKDNFLLSFEQEINAGSKQISRVGILTELERKVRQNVKSFVGNHYKRKIELSPQKLREIHDRGYTWKEIGFMYGKSEPTIYRWIKPNPKPLQKRGRKPIMDEALVSLLRSYVFQNNTKTQQEIMDYSCK